MQTLLLDIVVIFTLAILAAVVCHRLRVPTSVGLLLAGVLAGPDILGLIRNVHEIELLAEIGVVLLLFLIGLDFSLAEVAHLRRQFAVGGSLQFFGTAAIVALGTIAMGSTLQQGVYIGFLIALSSTAIVLRMLQERAELDTPHGRSVLAILIYQDAAVVPVMLVAPLLAGVAGGSALISIAGLVGKMAAVGAFAFVAYRWAVPWILERIAHTRSSETFLLGVITLCMGIALVTQSLGLSLALGAFLAGLIVSDSMYSHQAVTVMLPFRDVFMSLFFVSIGMLLDVQFLLEDPLRIAILTLGVLIIKPIMGAAASLAARLPLRYSVLTGLDLGQVGEFSLVAAQAGVVAGLLGVDVFQTVLGVAVLTMILTPVLVAMGPRFADAACRTPLVRLGRGGFSASAVSSAHSYADHILIVGFGVTGRNLARTAKISGVPYAVVEVNAGTVREALRNGEPIHFGDATQELILARVDAEKARAIAVVIDDAAGARRIVEISRRFAPDAYILVRSRYLREVEPLLALGADEVIADELEISIEVFSRVLARMLVPREDIERFIGDVRGEWLRMAPGLAKQATSDPDLRVGVPNLATHSIRLTEHSPLVGRSVAESQLRAEHGVTVLAITRGGEAVGNPRGETDLRVGDVLFVIGPADWDSSSVT